MNKKQCKQEIIELHRFFEEWFTGNIPKDQLTRLDNALADDFTIITPSAEIISKDNLMEMIRSGYARKSNEADTYKIWVDDIETTLLSETIVFSVYKEFQLISNVEKIRQSTVVFTSDEKAPNGVLWQHLHETWINS